LTAAIDRLTTALADQYIIKREIGAGGMASVYLAEDLKHRREVAVKVLRPELSASLGLDRFVREIEIAAKLTHPHILMLIDSGQADEFLYYVMPFVDGESLRERLGREGRLPVPDAVRITEQVASALSYAHERGVIHRDIKPENILCTGNHAIVADFGIARAVEAAGVEKLTGTGIAVGTPAYMSPEQALGDTNVDGRSDVYALGCVVYEMVGGRAPFEGATPQALLAKHAVESAPSLNTIDPTIPLFVERAVARALAKEPEQRFSTPNEFAATLASETVVPRVGRRRLAVLPPVNITGDPEQAFLVLGLHEALISRLGQGNVAVLARTSVMQYQRTEKPVREICKELSVEAVVESSIFRAGDAVGIQARLIDGNTEEGLWSGSYDGEISNVLALYRDVSGSIAGEIHGTMKPAATAAKREAAAVDPAAYEFYMRGRIHQQSFNPQDFDRALQYYEASLKLAPDYAPAYSGIALIWGSRTVLGLVPPLEAGPKWLEAANRAVELDPDLAEAHQALAQGYTWFDWDWERAEAAFKRAIELNPNEPQARIFYSHFLAMLGRAAESNAQAQRASEIDPFNPFTQLLHGMQLGLIGRLEDAIATLLEVPPNPLASIGLAWAHYRLGKMAEGLRHHARYFAMLGDTEIAQLLEQADDVRAALGQAADILAQRSENIFIKPMVIVQLYDWAGDLDQAFEWLERAYQLGDHEIAYLAVIPTSDAFRADPRFSEMLQRVNLPLPSRDT
jgi:TolB-like protein/tRNA A-37 threonylcarbamoyl transferase component Bud32